MAENKRKRGLRPIQDEKRLYFVLQLIFAALQILLCYTLVLQNNMSRAGVIIFALVGIGLMLLAGKCWQSRGARVFGRVIMVLLLAVFSVVVLLDVFTTGVTDATGVHLVARSFQSYADQLIADAARFVQPLLLVFFPTLAIAARRVGEKADIRLLRIDTWLTVLMAAATLVAAVEPGEITVLDFRVDLFGISPTVLLVIYLVCTLASVFAVHMSYPYAFLDRRRKTTEKE